jgi:hypothetical protein
VYNCAWTTQFTIIKHHPSQCKCWITLPNNLFSISWSESFFFIDVVLYNFLYVWITLSSNSFQFMELKIHESLFLCWLACCGNVVCVVFYMVHNGGHYVLDHLHMFVLLKFYIMCRSMFGVLSCHKFLNVLIVFCHPPFPWLWPFHNFSSEGTVYMLSLKILSQNFQPLFPFCPHTMFFEPIELMMFNTYINLLNFYDNANVLSKVSFMEFVWSRDIGTFSTNWLTKLGNIKID